MDYGEDTPLHRYLVEQFPDTAAEFCSSVFAQVLDTLSTSVLSFTVFDEGLNDMKDHYQTVNLTLPVLTEIAQAAFGADGDDGGDMKDASPTKKRSSQKAKKKAKRIAQGPLLDPKPFQRLAISIPATRAEADALASALLKDLQNSLLVTCISLLDCGVN